MPRDYLSSLGDDIGIARKLEIDFPGRTFVVIPVGRLDPPRPVTAGIDPDFQKFDRALKTQVRGYERVTTECALCISTKSRRVRVRDSERLPCVANASREPRHVILFAGNAPFREISPGPSIHAIADISNDIGWVHNIPHGWNVGLVERRTPKPQYNSGEWLRIANRKPDPSLSVSSKIAESQA